MMNTPTIKNFEIKELLATGGMASVYKAVQISLERIVALKILHLHLAQDANFITRFKREAKAAANLNHENIVNIIDYGEVEGAYFIAMEYVEGKSLEWVISSLKHCPLDTALAVVFDVCQGLNHAHQKGVVHRDIKPANILISYDGVAKIADFGVAQAKNFTSLTITGSMVGTPAYMSPEQAACKKVDHRSDIFSLGVVMYEMIAGTRPFRSDNYTALICEILTAIPMPLNEINPAVPERVSAIIGKMLEKDVDKRYNTISEVSRDILSYFHSRNYELSKREIAGLVTAPDGDALHHPEKEKLPREAPHRSDNVLPTADRTVDEAKKSSADIRTDTPLAGLEQKKEARHDKEKTPPALPKSTFRLSGVFALVVMVAAAVLFFVFIKRPPGETSPEEPAKESGRAILHSIPKGAAVVIDGKKSGALTPARIDCLSAGSHAITFEKNGYHSRTETLTVKVNDSFFLNVSLQKELPPIAKRSVYRKKPPHRKKVKTATVQPAAAPQNNASFLKIKVEPWAEIYIDGNHVETTPVAKPLRLSGGTHRVSLGNPNFRPWRKTISFKAGDTVDLNIKLEAAGGSLKLVVKPWADVYLDGKYYETTPIAKPIRLSAGKHSLKLINPTFKIHEEQIEISANAVTTKKVELQKK